MRYAIWGWAAVFDAGGNEVRDLSILRQLAEFVDAEDLYATDYIGGTVEEDAIAAALERSGQIRFALHDDESSLRVVSTFLARRSLTKQELDWLRKDTLGQCSDGMGECLFVPEGPYKDFKLQPLGADEVADSEYPFVTVTES